jgi:uncharacterized protein
VSEISDKFVEDAKTVLTVGDIVKVRVVAVDVGQKRISLSMKQETADGVAGAGANGPRGQRAGGPRGGHGRDNGRGNARPQGGIQGHATLADLKAKIAGKERPGAAPKKPAAMPGKMSALLKNMKKGF